METTTSKFYIPSQLKLLALIAFTVLLSISSSLGVYYILNNKLDQKIDMIQKNYLELDKKYKQLVNVVHKNNLANNQSFENNISDKWNEAVIEAPWIPSYYNHSFVFDGNLWLLGGWGNLKGAQQGVWKSADGLNWQIVSTDIPWGSGSHGFSTNVFKDKIWLLGGYSPDKGEVSSDVWSSSDGKNWVTKGNAPWSGRTGFSTVVFKDKLWIMGGHNNSNDPLLNDIWSTSDGISWKQELNSAPWKKRLSFSVAEFKNKLWLMGGINGYDSLSDVWVSENGIDWKIVTEKADWVGRNEHSLVVTPNKMYILAGRGYDKTYNDVWVSEDGLKWKKSTATWSARSGQTSSYFAGKIWVIGGYNDPKNDIIYNDIWNLEE